MLESSYEITKFLPTKIEELSSLEYISDYITKLNQSIEHKIETWIFLHTHILYMTFIYFQLLRISQIKEEEFKYSRIWLPANEKDFLKDNLNPFSFSKIHEKTVFRFFRLLDFDDWTIADISACVNERNSLLHATGIEFKDLDKKIEKYISNMEKIVEKSQDFLIGIYKKFTLENPYLFEKGYDIQYDDLELNFLIPYSVSEFEVEKLGNWIEEDKIIKKIYDIRSQIMVEKTMNINEKEIEISVSPLHEDWSSDNRFFNVHFQYQEKHAVLHIWFSYKFLQTSPEAKNIDFDKIIEKETAWLLASYSSNLFEKEEYFVFYKTTGRTEGEIFYPFIKG